MGRKRVKREREQWDADRARELSLTTEVVAIDGRELVLHHDRPRCTSATHAELVAIFDDPACRLHYLPRDISRCYLLYGYLDPCGFLTGRFSYFASGVSVSERLTFDSEPESHNRVEYKSRLCHSPTTADPLAMVTVALGFAPGPKTINGALDDNAGVVVVKSIEESGELIDWAETPIDECCFSDFLTGRRCGRPKFGNQTFFRAAGAGAEHTFAIMLEPYVETTGFRMIRFFSRSNPNIRSVFLPDYVHLTLYRDGFIYHRTLDDVARFVSATCPPVDLCKFKLHCHIDITGDKMYTEINFLSCPHPQLHSCMGGTDAYCVTNERCDYSRYNVNFVQRVIGVAPIGCKNADPSLFREKSFSETHVLCANYSGFVFKSQSFDGLECITRVRFEQKRLHDSDHEHDALQINDCWWGADVPSEDCAPKDLVGYEYPEGDDPAEGLWWDTLHQ